MPDQVAYVHHLHHLFRFRKIISEYAGLGIGPTDSLQQELGNRRVEAFRPSTERKALAYDALKTRLEKATIFLPNHPKMLQELRSLAFRLTPSGAMTIHHPGGGSDDYTDALMLASWAFRSRATRKSRVRAIPRARPPWG